MKIEKVDASVVSPSKVEGKKAVRSAPQYVSTCLSSCFSLSISAIGYGPKKLGKTSAEDDVVMSDAESDESLYVFHFDCLNLSHVVFVCRPSPSVAFTPFPTVDSDVELVPSETER